MRFDIVNSTSDFLQTVIVNSTKIKRKELQIRTPTTVSMRMMCIYLSHFRHNDLPYRYRTFADNKVYSVDLTADLAKLWNESLSQTDIPRLRTGKLGAQVGLQNVLNIPYTMLIKRLVIQVIISVTFNCLTVIKKESYST